MTTYPDLTRYEYGGTEEALNVGWLGSGEDFPTGAVEAVLLAKIAWLCCFETVNQMRGIHSCELCDVGGWDREAYIVVPGEGLRLLGTNEIRVVGSDGVRYAAPSLVLHYLVDHNYRPPTEFLDAVAGLERRLQGDWSIEILSDREARERKRSISDSS